MVAARQVDILNCRGIGRQRGRAFGALAQVIARTVFPLLRNYIVPAAKRVCVDLMKFAARVNAEVVSGRSSCKSAAKSAGRQTLTIQLGSGIKQRRFIPTKSTKQAVGHVETF